MARQNRGSATVTQESAPPRGQVLRDIVVLHLHARWCTAFGELLDEVLNDYGAVSERTFHRVLSDLVKEGRIVRLANSRLSGYIRAGSPQRPKDVEELLENLEERMFLVRSRHRRRRYGQELRST